VSKRKQKNGEGKILWLHGIDEKLGRKLTEEEGRWFHRISANSGALGLRRRKSSNGGGRLRFDLKTKGGGSALAYIELGHLNLDGNPE
jgi:hypothetical protein